MSDVVVSTNVSLCEPLFRHIIDFLNNKHETYNSIGNSICKKKYFNPKINEIRYYSAGEKKAERKCNRHRVFIELREKDRFRYNTFFDKFNK